MVILVLGTNDSKDYNWQSEGSFEAALGSYIDEVRVAGSPHLHIVLGTPPPTFPEPLRWKRGRTYNSTAFNIRMDRVRGSIRDCVFSVAEEHNVTLLDLYGEIESRAEFLVEAGLRMEVGTATVDDVAVVKTYYHDGVHPLSPTHDIIEAAVRNVVISLLNESLNTSSA
jgi:hypothetical protein